MDRYRLVQPSDAEIKVLYAWKTEEPNHELYTCRPVNPVGAFEGFHDKTLAGFDDSGRIHRVMIDAETKEPIGEVRGFDYNPRNRSMEFGYFLPGKNRHRGYGEIMIRKFIDEVFSDSRYSLNKLYATTSENYGASIGILEKTGFRLDGKNREHYWIADERYDQCIYSLLASEWEKTIG